MRFGLGKGIRGEVRNFGPRRAGEEGEEEEEAESTGFAFFWYGSWMLMKADRAWTGPRVAQVEEVSMAALEFRIPVDDIELLVLWR